MNTTYVQKNSTVQKIADSKVASLFDSSSQNESLQRKADMVNSAVQRAEAPRPNNTGMPDNLKSGIESLSGFSMDNVRVHYNSSKPATVQALAYTQGTDIHVAPGQEKHLPHEAWHVAQQMAGRVSPTTNINGMPVNDNAALEHEADVMGEKALETNSNPLQLKNRDTSSKALQRLKTVLLNGNSTEEFEIGFILFGSSRYAPAGNQRANISRDNPAFAGIINAGHTMLHGLSPNIMFSYGFWTDNMNAKLGAAFKKQMDADKDKTTGVVGEYRNDTHLSMIMQPEEIRVVVRVSKETFNKWLEFVTSDKGVVRYTFHPGYSNAGHRYGLDNCVSFAFLQMTQFINNNEKELKKQHLDAQRNNQRLEAWRKRQDLDALYKMQDYIRAFQAKMQDRYKKTRNRSGLQGVLMGVTNVFDVGATEDPILNAFDFSGDLREDDDVMDRPEYKLADAYTGLIYGDVIKEMAEQDCRNMIVQPIRSNVEKFAKRRIRLSTHSRFKTPYDHKLLSAYVKLYTSIYLKFYTDTIKEMAKQDGRDMRVRPIYNDVEKFAKGRIRSLTHSRFKILYDHNSPSVKLYIDTYLEFCKQISKEERERKRRQDRENKMRRQFSMLDSEDYED
nr:DUF4157 domain-containing protein [Fibrobacter sp. UWH4]